VSLKKWVLLLLAAVALGVVTAFAMLGAAMGDCALDTSCISEAGRHFLFFGSPAAAAVALGFIYLGLRKGSRS
jgi:hypothetical protein